MPALDKDLPDALAEDFGSQLAGEEPRTDEERKAERLAALGLRIADKRDAAIKARVESGIETVWAACEEAYLGVDDVNRADHPQGTRWHKPTSSDGPVTTARNRGSSKATAFVPLTARYVDMGRAKVCELLLPVDDKAFTIDPPSSPDLAQAAATGQAPGQAPGSPVPPVPATATTPGQPAAPVPGSPANPVTPVADAAQQVLSDDKTKAQKAEDWIYDRLKESRYPAQMRKVVHDAARLGVGVLKGPFPNEVKTTTFSAHGNEAVVKVVSAIRPATSWMDPWNLFPAPGCGEDVHDGDHIFERDFFSPGRLKALANLTDETGQPIYLSDAIARVLAEGPTGAQSPAQTAPSEDQAKLKHRFEVWTMHGTLDREDLKACGAVGLEDLPDQVSEAYAIVTLVNQTVIRATIHPLRSGKFPYRVLPWSRRAGHWAGIGIGERVAFPQSLINAATRAIINNAGKSAGVHMVFDRRAITPVDGSWDLNVGDKLWQFTGDQLVEDINKIFYQFQVKNLTAELMPLVDYASKLAEEATNISLVTQGHAGKFDPETFGQAEMQDDNAHTLLRDLAYNVDDTVTEPMVTDFYEWYLLDVDVPDADKGTFQVNARGSSSLVERVIQEATMPGIINLALNPAFGQDPKKLMAQFLRTKRLDPSATAYSPEDLARMQNTPPPPAPAVQAANVRAAAALHVEEMRGDQRLRELQFEAQQDERNLVAGGSTPHEAMAMARIRDSQIRAETSRYVEDSRANAEAARAEKELQTAQAAGEYKLRELEMQRDILLLEYAQKQNLTLMQVKGQLANTALQVRAKNDLHAASQAFDARENQADRTVDLHKHHTALAADAQAARAAADQVDTTTGRAADTQQAAMDGATDGAAEGAA